MANNNNDFDLDAYLDSIPGMPSAPKQQQQPNQGNGTIDVTQALMQRLMQQHGPMVPQPPQQQNMYSDIPAGTEQPQRKVVYLKEGSTYYKKIPADMSNIPVAMKAGPATNVNGKEFIIKSMMKCYLVENHHAVDLSNIDHSQLQTLYAIEAPWTGTILVPESSIVNINQGPTILKG